MLWWGCITRITFIDMSRNLTIGVIIIAGILLIGTYSYAAPFLYQVGGTGTTTAALGQLRGMGVSADFGVPTTTASCTGSASCTAFTVLGSSPITITSTGGSGSISTSSTGVVSSLLYFTTAGATPEKVNPVATSSPTFNGGLTTSGTAGAWVGGSSYTVSIANNGVTLGLLATLAANSVIGNKTGSTATPTALATSSDLFTGSLGQNAFFNGTNSLIGTSSLFLDTTSFIGIGSTTPYGLLSINPKTGQNVPSFVIGSSTATIFSITPFGGGDLLDIATSTTNGAFYAFSINSRGEMVTKGATPTLGTCGTATIFATSTDMRGTVVVTGGNPTTCNLTFSAAKVDTPTCVVTDNSSALAVAVTAASTTGVQFGMAALFSGNLHYICLQ